MFPRALSILSTSYSLVLSTVILVASVESSSAFLSSDMWNIRWILIPSSNNSL